MLYLEPRNYQASLLSDMSITIRFIASSLLQFFGVFTSVTSFQSFSLKRFQTLTCSQTISLLRPKISTFCRCISEAVSFFARSSTPPSLKSQSYQLNCRKNREIFNLSNIAHPIPLFSFFIAVSTPTTISTLSHHCIRHLHCHLPRHLHSQPSPSPLLLFFGFCSSHANPISWSNYFLIS